MGPSDSDFSRFELAGWERAAPEYEAWWSGLTGLFIPHLLDALDLRPGVRLLDVACGPGYVAGAAHARGAVSIGVDFSSEMIRLARAGHPGLEFRSGDAQALDFEDGRFDVVAMNFGVLHLADPPAAFAEAYRVLRPGGRYGFTVWAGPALSPGAGIVDAAMRDHAELDVPIPAGPDYFAYGDPDACRQALGAIGFDRASMAFRTVTQSWLVPTASFLFEAERDGGVRTAALLRAQSSDRQEAIRRRIEEGVSAYAVTGGFALPFTAHVVTAVAGTLDR